MDTQNNQGRYVLCGYLATFFTERIKMGIRTSGRRYGYYAPVNKTHIANELLAVFRKLPGEEGPNQIKINDIP